MLILDRKRLGAQIKASRLENKMTQEHLAEVIEIAPSHVKQIEAGTRNPSIEVLYKLVITLNFSVDDIFFPDRNDGKELLHKIERSLRLCTLHDLRVINSTITALLDESENDAELYL